MRLILLLCLLLISSVCLAQPEQPFSFGDVTYDELNFKYEKDTSASAVVLEEFGHSEIDNSSDHNLLFTHRVKIKILKKAGLDLANLEFELRKGASGEEFLRYVKASIYNIENGNKTETKFNQKNIFTENYKNGNIKKLTLPNVHAGSVIEYEYQVETPFFSLNFYPWEFQREIPKLMSEYWAIIPANYRYNIALRGVIPLAKNQSEVLSKYFTPGGGHVSDCTLYRWRMNDIPAFIEEEYMTSKRNFISAIQFELTEFQYFDGRKDKVTKEWKDIDKELRTYEKFGVQLRRGKEVAEAQVNEILTSEPNPLARAQKIFDFIRGWFDWNENVGIYSEYGIKKAFEEKTGNVGDINLTLVAALRFAGFDADPLILSTRKNGVLTDLFPVMTEFNYVIAKVDLDGKTYLLDATDDFLPFGIVPERCLNGKGRVMAKESSYWLEIKPSDRFRRFTQMQLKLSPAGGLTGTVTSTYNGYKAGEVRNAIYSSKSHEEYIRSKAQTLANGEITKFSFSNLALFNKPMVEVIELNLDPFDGTVADMYLLNPFVMGHVSRNPFTASERNYPVDYGAPLEETDAISIELPPGMEIAEIPPKVGLSLPNNGGRFLYEVRQNGNVIVVNSSFVISKTIFTSEEYHFLKEMYNRVIKTLEMDLVLKKRPGN